MPSARNNVQVNPALREHGIFHVQAELGKIDEIVKEPVTELTAPIP